MNSSPLRALKSFRILKRSVKTGPTAGNPFTEDFGLAGAKRGNPFVIPVLGVFFGLVSF
jgi:hypothetical protein